jgi:membrane protease YdiL (CAAX protease family)
VFFLETLVVLVVSRFAGSLGRQSEISVPEKRQTARKVLYGVAGGIALLAASTPILFRMHPESGPVQFLINHLYSFQGFAFAVLLFLAIPITSEYVFRGVIFGDLKENTGLFAAALGSSILFAYLWPMYGLLLGFLLGMVTALLYDRMNSLVPSMISNIVFTFTSVCLLAWRYLSSH